MILRSLLQAPRPLPTPSGRRAAVLCYTARPLGPGGLDRCPATLPRTRRDRDAAEPLRKPRAGPRLPLLGSPGRGGAPRLARAGGLDRPARPCCAPSQVRAGRWPRKPASSSRRRSSCCPSTAATRRAGEQARERGEAALRAGRVAAMVVAGGQATRLGYDGPKGLFPIGPVTQRSLFELQAQKLRGLARRYGRRVPWYVMTSQATDAATRAFFERSGRFGLPADDVFFFRQGMVPSFDFEDRIVLERPDRIMQNPDGHGGSLTALLASGALDDMQRRGIDTLFYYQVDNPLVQICDPVYLGLPPRVRRRDVVQGRPQARPDGEGRSARARGRGDARDRVHRADGRVPPRARRPRRAALLGREHGAARLLAPLPASRVRLRGSLAPLPRLGEEDSDGRRPGPSGRAARAERPQARALRVRRAARGARRVRGRDEPRARIRAGEERRRSRLPRDGAARADGALPPLARPPAGIEPPPPGTRIEIDHSRVDGEEDARALGIRTLAQAAEFVRTAAGADA